MQSIRLMPRFDDVFLKDSNPSTYSFLNLASIGCFLGSKSESTEGIAFYSDGWLLTLVFSVLLQRKFHRVSFDYTSIAGRVFDYLKEINKTVFVIGATEEQVASFVNKVTSRHGDIVSGFCDGYVPEEKWQDVVSDIIESKATVLIVGLGAGLQEKFAKFAIHSGFDGVVYTCGGFIRQEACSGEGDYYPTWVDRLSLRFLYRMYKEPHTIGRYLFSYPKNLLCVILALVQGKIRLEVL